MSADAVAPHPRVLVAEDDSAMRALLVQALEKGGFEVTAGPGSPHAISGRWPSARSGPHRDRTSSSVPDAGLCEWGGRAMTSPVHANDRADAVIREFLRTGKTMVEDLRPVIEMLRYAIPAHFEQEEQPGGLFAQLSASGAQAAAARLLDDHAEFQHAVTQLGNSLVSGEAGIPLKLEDLARRMRQHERIESIYNARFGSPVPTAPDPTRPPIDNAVAVALSCIAAAVAEQAQVNPGSMVVGLLFSLPQGVARRDAFLYLEQELATLGFHFVELEAHVKDGPPRLLDATLEPGWA